MTIHRNLSVKVFVKSVNVRLIEL